MKQTRREYHQAIRGKKIMKKVKGKWVTALAAGLLLGPVLTDISQHVAAQESDNITIELILEKETVTERLESVLKDDHVFVVNTDDTIEIIFSLIKEYDYKFDKNNEDDQKLIEFLEAFEIEDFIKINSLEEDEGLEVGQLLEVRLEVLKFAFENDFKIDFSDNELIVSLETEEMIELIKQQNETEVGVVSVDSTRNNNMVQPVVATTPSTPEAPVTPELPEKPTTPETPETPETPDEPSAPELPQEDKDEELPTDKQPGVEEEIVQDHVVGEVTQIILSEEEIYDGKTGEEITVVAGEKYLKSSDTIELDRDEVAEVLGTETYLETYIEQEEVLVEVQKQVKVGEDENGEPIYEKQTETEPTGGMKDVEKTREAQREIVIAPASVTVTNQTTEIYGIPFNVISIFDNTLESGYEEVLQEGVEGESTQVYTTTLHNDVVVSTSEKVETTLSTPQDKIVKVGTKEVVGIKQVILESQVTTKGLIKRVNPELYEDEGYLITGQDGYTNKTIERITVDESVNETVLEEDSQEAIYDIEVVGTKPIVTTKTEVLERVIDFKTEYKEYPGIDQTETVIQKGQTGLALDTYLVTYHKGKEVSRELVSSETKQEPVNQVVQIGKVTSDVYRKEIITEKEVLPYFTSHYVNPESTSLKPVVIQEGLNGEALNYYEISYNNAGEEISRELIVIEVLTAPEMALIELSLDTVEIKEYKKEYNESLSYFMDDINSLYNLNGAYGSEGRLSEYITFVEDVNLATGEILVINEGKIDSSIQGIKEFYYKGELIDQGYGEYFKNEEVIKQIVKVGVNPNKLTSDVSNPKNIKWIDYKLSKVELDENGDYVYDENNELKFKTIDVKIPDLNHYFRENVKKFSSIAFDDNQLSAISDIIFRPDSEYKLDEEFFYGSANDENIYGAKRLKGKYLYSLLTKQQFYQKLFLVNNGKAINSIDQNELKFNEEEFEFEAVVSPDSELLVDYKPHLLFPPLFTKETVINSRIEKNQNIEEIELIEEFEIGKGYREEKDPTKFFEELYDYSEGVNGKLTRKYFITKVDGLETKRELIDLEVKPSKPTVEKRGIRGGIRFIGGK